MVPPASRRVSRAPRYSGSRVRDSLVTPTGLSPSMAGLSRPLGFLKSRVSRPYNPRAALTARVWAGPLSLAATRGVACLLSPPAATKMFQFAAFACLAAWPLGRVPPFGHPRVTGRLRLAAEFRRLSRPSSPLGAWASPVRPSSFLFAWGRAASPRPPPASRSACQCAFRATPLVVAPVGVASCLDLAILTARPPRRGGPPERRCSSRTFRYGYLVTT